MKIISFLLFILFVYKTQAQERKSSSIAFVADIHFLDIYAEYENFEGLQIPGTGKKAKIRTMNAQMHSTRLFNENYFVLKAILDDIAERGIKLVALPGDYTDDGQPINLKGLAEVLNFYKENHGISFFITTGNHDPVHPFGEAAGKNDFLGENGKNQPIFSEEGLYVFDAENEQPVIIEKNIRKAGYDEILGYLSNFGFFPQEDYLYWDTPFSNYGPENYSFKKALDSSKIENRKYRINETHRIPDVSYVVEPVEGLWLLAIDGNTYVPQEDGSLSGAGIGYNNAINFKQHLFTWIRDVAENAEEQNKTIIAFSHYPAVDFNEDSSKDLRQFLGEDKWQLERIPEERIAKTLAKAGVKIHFSGHMHINDTGKRVYNEESFLINIQTPSLAAYVPGYKILSLNENTAEVETISIDEVPGFNGLFPLYEVEYDRLERMGRQVWDKMILQSKNYRAFTESHLENLTKLRFVPNDWSADFHTFLSGLSGRELLLLSEYSGPLSPPEFLNDETEMLKVQNLLGTDIQLDDFEHWFGEQMIFDFYKIRNADKLAFEDIPTERLQQYKIVTESFKNNTYFKNPDNENAQKLRLFMGIFGNFMQGLPAVHFQVNLQSGEIKDLNPQ